MPRLSLLAACVSAAALSACVSQSPGGPQAASEDAPPPGPVIDGQASPLGLYLAGQAALGQGRGDVAASYFAQASREDSDAAFLKDSAFQAALASGDVRRAAQSAPTAGQGSAGAVELGELTRAVEELAEDRGRDAEGLLAGHPLTAAAGHRGQAAPALDGGRRRRLEDSARYARQRRRSPGRPDRASGPGVAARESPGDGPGGPGVPQAVVDQRRRRALHGRLRRVPRAPRARAGSDRPLPVGPEVRADQRSAAGRAGPRAGGRRAAARADAPAGRGERAAAAGGVPAGRETARAGLGLSAPRAPPRPQARRGVAFDRRHAERRRPGRRRANRLRAAAARLVGLRRGARAADRHLRRQPEGGADGAGPRRGDRQGRAERSGRHGAAGRRAPHQRALQGIRRGARPADRPAGAKGQLGALLHARRRARPGRRLAGARSAT